jgi:alpha-soluble NSF attachment protein
MEGQEQKALVFENDAQAKLKSSSWFFWVDTNAKYEEAGDLYVKAANCWKMAKQHVKAGNAYMQAAQCYANYNSSKYETAGNFVKAATSYRKDCPQAATEALIKAIHLYAEEGKFNMAAKYEKELAEMYEAELDTNNALKHYEIAAEYFENENSPSAANQCLLKVAHFAATLQNFARAVELFEQIASTSVNNNLLKWSAKEYFLKAGLCHLAQGDLVAVKKSLDRYSSLSPEFQGSREYIFLQQLITAYEKFEVDAFKKSVGVYSEISPLQPWTSAVLVTITEKIRSDENGDDYT